MQMVYVTFDAAEGWILKTFLISHFIRRHYPLAYPESMGLGQMDKDMRYIIGSQTEARELETDLTNAYGHWKGFCTKIKTYIR